MARGGGGHSGGGGGFHGGGHSGGGGSFGGRSGSHSSFGGGHSGGSLFGGGHSSSGGSHYSHSNYGTPHHGPMMHNTRPSRYYGRRGSSGCGCGGAISGIVTLIAVLIIVSTVIELMMCITIGSCVSCASCATTSCATVSGSNVELTTSTEKREKMDSKYLNYSNTWYTDELGWFGIQSDRTLINGLESFYKKTGVQPYVYLAAYDANLFASEQARVEYAEELYDKLFTDEGHFLWVYFACNNDTPDYMDGYYYYIVGKDAEIVMDENAKDIFETRLQYYYDDTSLDVDEFLAAAFSSSGKAIMSGPIRMRYVVLIIVGVLVIVGVVVAVVLIRKKRKLEKEKENEELEKLLRTPLQTYGAAEAESLKNKYDNE